MVKRVGGWESIFKETVAVGVATCYNVGALGNRLAVGHVTLDHVGQVRILVPQPVWKHSELLFKKKELVPALVQFLMSEAK